MRYGLHKIAETTGKSLDEVRQISQEDYYSWLAYFGLNYDIEKEAHDKALGKIPKHTKSKGNVVDITHLLDEATRKGKKTIDLSGLSNG